MEEKEVNWVTFGDLSFAIETDSPGEFIGHGYIFKTREIVISHLMKDPEFYRQGWNSWSPTGWRKLTEKPLKIYDNPLRLLTADDVENFLPGQHSGSYVGALTDLKNNCLLLGSLSISSGVVSADTKCLKGIQNSEDSVWFLSYGDELEVFSHYSNLLIEKFGQNTLKAGNVWSSWYTFFEDINATDLKITINELKDLEIDVIQIDDGWQKNIGDWSANEKFPEGMEEIAKYIKSKNKKAGLWVAPLICLAESEIAQKHPEWLLKDIDGNPVTAGYNWSTTYFTFDTTIKDFQNYLFNLFKQFKEWGFDYFKLDFMYAGALSGVRSNNLDRETAYRDILKVIREAVTPESYLLGSGVLILPSMGIFNGVRVGPDTAPYWDNTERKNDPSGPGAWNAICNSLNRYWLKNIYEADPDAVFFRSKQNLLDEKSKMLLQTVAQILGFKSFSDPINWLDKAELQDLNDFLKSECNVKQLKRHVFQVDEKIVDFTEIINPTKRVSDFILLK